MPGPTVLNSGFYFIITATVIDYFGAKKKRCDQHDVVKNYELLVL
jgi:hypothetical protein